MKKPKPIVTEQVCDICGEDWNLHPESPTCLDCINILKRLRQPRPVRIPQWQWYQSVIPPNTTATPYTINTPNVCTTADDVLAGYTLTNTGNVHPFRRPDDDDGLSGVRVPA